MKSARQSAILEIISQKTIETQNQLLQELIKRGVSSTQATLSRDIKELRLIKEQGADGRSRYALPANPEPDSTAQRLRTIFREGVLSYDVAQNLFVIRTLPGLASAACSAIDAVKIQGLVGTLAGDDTAFLAMRDEASAQALYQELEKLF